MSKGSDFVSVAPHGWAVANTQPHRECTAVQHLERQKFATYCPMIAKRVRRARKWIDVRRPLFPGYVFVRLDGGTQRWRPILSTIGVRSLILQGERPSLLDEGFIASLRAREKGGVVIGSAQPLEKGQAVRLSGGYFEGLTATIVELDQSSRVTILLNMLNGSVRAKVPLDTVRAA